MKAPKNPWAKLALNTAPLLGAAVLLVCGGAFVELTGVPWAVAVVVDTRLVRVVVLAAAELVVVVVLVCSVDGKVLVSVKIPAGTVVVVDATKLFDGGTVVVVDATKLFDGGIVVVVDATKLFDGGTVVVVVATKLPTMAALSVERWAARAEDAEASEAEAAELRPATAVDAEERSLEAWVRADAAAWETLFWMEAPLGMGTGTTVGTCVFAAEATALSEEPAWEAFWLIEAPAWEAWLLIEAAACEAFWLADWAAPAIAWEAEPATAEGAIVMAVEGRDTLEGSWMVVE